MGDAHVDMNVRIKNYFQSNGMVDLDQGFLTGGKFDLPWGKFCQQKIHNFTYYNSHLQKWKNIKTFGSKFYL